MPKQEISVQEAKQDKLFYVVTNLIIIDSSARSCLLLKRSEDEKVLPGKWAFSGGKLEHSDVTSLLTARGRAPLDGIDNILGELAKREAIEECGLDVSVDNASIIKNKVFVRPDGVPVFMVTLATTYQGGSVELEDQAFSDYTWVTLEQLDDYDCIPGIAEEAGAALALFS